MTQKLTMHNKVDIKHINATVDWDMRKGVIKCDNCGDIEPLKDVSDVDPTVDIIDTFTELHAECPIRLHDETAKEWADRMSEFDYCSECGRDINDPAAHDIIVFVGNWFARCKGGNTE